MKKLFLLLVLVTYGCSDLDENENQIANKEKQITHKDGRFYVQGFEALDTVENQLMINGDTFVHNKHANTSAFHDLRFKEDTNTHSFNFHLAEFNSYINHIRSTEDISDLIAITQFGSSFGDTILFLSDTSYLQKRRSLDCSSCWLNNYPLVQIMVLPKEKRPSYSIVDMELFHAVAGSYSIDSAGTNMVLNLDAVFKKVVPYKSNLAC